MLLWKCRGRAAELATANLKKRKGNIPTNLKEVTPNLSQQLRPPLPEPRVPLPNMLEASQVAPIMPDIEGVSLDPDLLTREQLRQSIAKHLLCQAVEANPKAVERKTFPFKHFVEFAFKYQLTLEGWLIDACPTFPGDVQFQVDKIHRHQWRDMWDPLFEDKTLRLRRWTAGSGFIVFVIHPLLTK